MSELHTSAIPISETNTFVFGIRASHRLQQIYAIGKTGVGKSTQLYHKALQDISSGAGVAILDPHGNVAAALVLADPSSRRADHVYFNASDTKVPVGFNPLQVSDHSRIHLLASEIVSIFKKLWIDSWVCGWNTSCAIADSPSLKLVVKRS